MSLTTSENSEHTWPGPNIRGLIDRWGALALRAASLVALLAAELATLGLTYTPTDLVDAAVVQDWMGANSFVRNAVFIFGPVVAIAFFTLAWTKLRGSIERWRDDARDHVWLPWLVANAGIFGVALLGSITLSASLPQATTAPWAAALALLCLGVVPIFLTMGLALAPLRFWRHFVRRHAVSILIAIATGVLVSLASWMTQGIWYELAGWTMHVTAGILNLYKSEVWFDIPTRTIGTGNFAVIIDSACSGYEGIGLVSCFLAVFVWAFRAELRMPNALLIFPVGIIAIWCLNAVRIAILISLGAHVSPELAVNGFHSQAGWIMFLIVSIGLMFALYRVPFFRAAAAEAPKALDPGIRQACAYLLPFIAILSAGIIATAAAVDSTALYALSVVAACAVMWPFRDIYLALVAKPQMVSILAGLVVGVGWIITDPKASAGQDLGLWLQSLPPWLALAWIAVRVVGTSVFVPVAEELAFRGYLHRALITRNFEQVAPGKFAWHAFVITTVLFGLMHGRWLSAGIAGAVYALVLYRSNRISDAIVAHMASNALIAAWAVAWGQWSLL